jgi:hypothetical protein
VETRALREELVAWWRLEGNNCLDRLAERDDTETEVRAFARNAWALFGDESGSGAESGADDPEVEEEWAEEEFAEEECDEEGAAS